MLKHFLAERAKNQQHKRDLETRRQEQELRWKEEDRAAQRAERARNSAVLGHHVEAVRRLTGISYIVLRCHEDTWAFMARIAFGHWEPSWVQSRYSTNHRHGPNGWQVDHFTVNPNLPSDRIRKGADGMQDVCVSGHNLVRILDTLRTATQSEDLVHGARARTLYEKIAMIAVSVDPAQPSGKTTGVVVHIDDSIAEQPLKEFRRGQDPLLLAMSSAPATSRSAPLNNPAGKSRSVASTRAAGGRASSSQDAGPA